MKKKVLKIAKLLLVVLFVSYYCESSLFYHTHYFSWGVVTHSHPYLPAGSGTPGHNHTPVQCDTIAQLSMLLFVAGISLVSFFVPGVEVRFRPPVRHGAADRCGYRSDVGSDFRDSATGRELLCVGLRRCKPFPQGRSDHSVDRRGPDGRAFGRSSRRRDRHRGGLLPA